MAGKRKTPWVWLVVAAVLLGLGAWLMRGAEPPDREPLDPIRLPTRMTREESTRATERRTWVPLVAPPDAGPAVPQPPKDPVLALMPAEVKRGVVVAEFNAIVNSELGGLMTECLFGDGDGFLGDLRDAGLDPTTKVDRVAFIDDSMVVTGDFKNAQWRQFLPREPVTKGYGRQGELVEVPKPDGGVETFATWGGQMFIAGGDEASLKRVLDRLDGTGPQVDKPVLDDSMAFGEVYGVLNAQSLARLVGKEDPAMAELVERSAKSVEVHMDVGHDVGLVADVNPSDAKTTDELRRTLGSALSLARMKAQAEGKGEEADILDMARVKAADEGGGFRLEAGLPHDYLAKSFRECIAERKARRERDARVPEPTDAGP